MLMREFAFRCCRFLHPLAVHAISGAVGEVCQTACLYPLNTIAVRLDEHIQHGGACAAIHGHYVPSGSMCRCRARSLAAPRVSS